MAKRYDPYETDQEARDLARARTAEAQARADALGQRQGGTSYAQSHGYPDTSTMTAAETARERAATNTRLTQTEAEKNRLEALKAMHAAASVTPGGEAYSKAALDEIAKMSGVTVPKTMNPQEEKANKIRAAKGLAPTSAPETTQPPGSTAGLVTQPTAPSNESIFQPNYTPPPEATGPAPGTQPVPAGGYGTASLGVPITPHLGIGGAEITPENPTGDIRNPWGAGGLFQNPTHFAALNQQVQRATMYPTGPVSPSRPTSYFPGEAQDRLAGGRAIAPPTGVPGPPTDVYASRGLELTPTGGVPPLPGGLVTPPAGPSRATGNMLPTPVANTQPAGPIAAGPAGPTAPAPSWASQPVNVDLDAIMRAQAAQMRKRTNF